MTPNNALQRTRTAVVALSVILLMRGESYTPLKARLTQKLNCFLHRFNSTPSMLGAPFRTHTALSAPVHGFIILSQGSVLLFSWRSSNSYLDRRYGYAGAAKLGRSIFFVDATNRLK